jgi:hypothetical protein
MLPGFSCRDLVAVLINYNDGEAERRLIVSSAYLPYDSEDPPPSSESEELVRYCEENLYIVIGCNSDSRHTVWGSANCNVGLGSLVGISKFLESGDSKSGL